MSTSIWKRLIITGLAACTIAALAAPASGQALHRDGSKAVAFVGDVSNQSYAPSSGPVLHRDGSQAVPFFAALDGGPVSTAADRFDWGDAAVGAAAALGLTLLASENLPITGSTVARFRITNGRSPAEIIRALMAIQLVAVAQPNYVYTLQQQPSDPVPASRGDATQGNPHGPDRHLQSRSP